MRTLIAILTVLTLSAHKPVTPADDDVTVEFLDKKDTPAWACVFVEPHVLRCMDVRRFLELLTKEESQGQDSTNGVQNL